jgi:hypothetical protein
MAAQVPRCSDYESMSCDGFVQRLGPNGVAQDRFSSRSELHCLTLVVLGWTYEHQTGKAHVHHAPRYCADIARCFGPDEDDADVVEEIFYHHGFDYK